MKLPVSPIRPSSHLLDDHPELALLADHRLDPGQPLDVGEYLGWANQNLAWVKTIGLVVKNSLITKSKERKLSENINMDNIRICQWT